MTQDPFRPEGPSGPLPTARPGRRWRLFARDRSGTTAIEFAILGIPFLVLIGGILEFGVCFLVNRTLDNAMMESARLIKTGQAQTMGFDKAAFKADVCDRLTTMLCDNARLEIDVRTFDNFGQISDLPPMVGVDGNFGAGLGYTESGPGQIIVARAVYAWPMASSLLATSPADAGGKRYLYSTQVFRNEPFQTGN
ncbi:TadE/TadG family type IV pilus assembly protein [Pannonibacter tanglangensis]|uniref:Pilus assembly protein n=1 Tax=Pannonibacter tanglangensis TaxID=2750084 RepID=A0ABW9ZK18_9HYPH|nr:TadE/TadG family type IV pilus assembly protein [Pannonibacter sp. XCT-34]NBN64666.1 pilus assembly protein [Pannonibacter sp. XCT-34]